VLHFPKLLWSASIALRRATLTRGNENVALGPTLFFSFVALASFGARADLRKELAEKFQVDPDYFVLNLPPRPGCLPGSMFTEDLRVLLQRSKVDDPDLQFGPRFNFKADLSFDADAKASVGVLDWFGVAAKASDASDASMDVTDAQVIEILGPALKRRVLNDPDALAASARKVPPFAVIRAFYGRVTFKLSKKLGASSEAWAQANQVAVDAKVGARIENDGSVSISVAEPFVFGFEVVQLNYVTQHLGSKIDDVALAPVPADLFSR
jgi:hypothetical protein